MYRIVQSDLFNTGEYMKHTRESITAVVLNTVKFVRGKAKENLPLTMDMQIMQDLHLGEDVYDLVLLLQERTGITPPKQEWEKARTIGDIVELLLKCDPIKIAQQAFAEIHAHFPQIEVTEYTGDQHSPVGLQMTFPVQSKIKHEINLILSGDELHFSVSHFYLEWFPCTKPDVVKDYIETVSGFLSGEYRVLELYAGTKCVKAKLQAPKNGDWSTIGTWSTLRALLPWPRKTPAIVRAGS